MLQILQKYSKDLFTSAIKRKTVMNLDAFLYILGIPQLILTLLLVVVNTIFYLVGEMPLEVLLQNYLMYIVTTFLLPMLSALFVLVIEKKPIRPMTKAILMFPIFMGSWILINIKAIFKPNTKWEKIVHSQNITIDDVDSKKKI